MAARAFGLVLLTGLMGCSGDSAKKHLLLAERLWNDGNYAASVTEFEKVITRDPKGKLGQQAMLRAATTEAYFLGRYGDAVRKLKTLSEQTADPAISWDAKKQIGEILYAKTEQYEPAASHYQALVAERPKAPEVPEFLFRIAKSQFFLWQFDDALRGFSELRKKYPDSVWAERAAYEIGMTLYTQGEHRAANGNVRTEAYQHAMDAFEFFIRQYPKSSLVAEARFGIASCFEELDQLDAAYQLFATLKSSYPSPNVIEIKLARIKERKHQRRR